MVSLLSDRDHVRSRTEPQSGKSLGGGRQVPTRREPSPATVGVKRPRSVETEAYRPVVVARSVPAITNGPVIARSVPDMVPEQRPRTKEGPTEADSERRSSAIGMDTVHHAAQPAPGIRAVRPPLLECQEGDDGLRPPREQGKRPRRCARYEIDRNGLR